MTAQTASIHEGAVRILLAEDNAINGELLAMMARRLGVQLDHASDGLEALRRVSAAVDEGRPYDLVMMDIMMPVMDGMECTRRLRAAGHDAASLPVLAVTAATAPEEVREYAAAGMQAYLAKPLRLDDFESVLAAWGPGRNAALPLAERAPRASLKQRYRRRKAETLAQIEAVLRDGMTEPDVIAAIVDALHKLAGTAGSFGEDELSKAAAECEASLVNAEKNQILAVLESGLGELKKVG